jgi:hypothetical protein
VRRVLVLLFAVFLVNLPFVHETWTDRQIDRNGTEVQATVIDSQVTGGHYLLDYRLPRSVDPKQTRFSARVDRATYERAQETKALLVRVVPGKPSANEPVGAVTSHLFGVVALLGDLVLVLVGLALYRRWRQRSQHVVVEVRGDDVVLESAAGQVTVVGPDGWAQRVRAGQRVTGGLHLVTDAEVVTGSVVGGLEQVRGASYVARGRVVDARAGQLTLELYDRTRLRVETGRHRIRADIRDPAEIHGTLCFTPTGFARGPRED